MPVDFSQFSPASTIPTSAYFVGYDKNESGGERKWTLSTVANAVIGGGFLFVPVNDPTDPLNNNSNASGLNVINFSATGNTTATPYTGATQTANLASIVPDNAYMVLVKIFTNSNLFSNSDDQVYVRIKSSAPWSRAGVVEGVGNTFETSQTWTLPIIFDRNTKSFQAYYYDAKTAGAPSSAPTYNMQFSLLGYYIK